MGQYLSGNLNLFLFCVYGHFDYMYACACPWWLWSLEEGLGTPLTRITDNYEPQMWVQEIEPGSSRRTTSALKAGPSC